MSLKWLGLNRPDYKDVVTTTMNELKAEIIANRDAINFGADPARRSMSRRTFQLKTPKFPDAEADYIKGDKR